MPWLPLLEQDEFSNAADVRLNFLDKFSNQAENLIKEEQFLSDDPVNNEPWLLPSVAALTEAAEIAFATNNTERGLHFTRNALSKIMNEKKNVSSFARMSSLSAILGEARTTLNADGPSLTTLGSPEPQIFHWEASSPVLRAASGTLVAAALASDEPRSNFELLSRREESGENTKLARIAVTLASETATLPLFDMSRDDDGFLRTDSPKTEDKIFAAMSFLSLHERYAASLRLNMSDKLRWRQLRCRAPLIDWPLLLLHLAIRRQKFESYFYDLPFFMYSKPIFPLKFENAGLAGRLFIFMKSLAVAIDKQTPQ